MGNIGVSIKLQTGNVDANRHYIEAGVRELDSKHSEKTGGSLRVVGVTIAHSPQNTCVAHMSP